MVDEIREALEDWHATNTIRGPEPDIDRAARMIAARMRGESWRTIAKREGITPGTACKAVQHSAERIGVHTRMVQMHAKNQQAPTKPTPRTYDVQVDADAIELATTTARIVWRLACTPGSAIVGDRPTVANRLGFTRVRDALPVLVALDAACVVRFSEFHSVDGRPRWSVGVRRELRR